MIAKELRTKNLYLSVLRPKDAEALFNIWSDPIVTKFMNIDSFKEVLQAKEMISFFETSLLENKAVRYGIFYNDICIGSCGYNYFYWETGETEIGYELAKEFWNRGFGSEIVTILCQNAFTSLKLTKVNANVEKNNTASQKLLEKNTFKLIGETQDGLFHYSKVND